MVSPVHCLSLLDKATMMKRMWINQPSTYQEFHKYHGKNVLLDTVHEVIYFLEGPVISMQVPLRILAKGWL